MRFLLACAGTAGHINPALAVANKLRETFPDAGFLFVGSGRDLEKSLIPAAGFELRNITITGFARGMRPGDIKHNLKTARNLSVSRRECAQILDDFGPDAVIGTGGYVCYPVLKAAARRGIPTLIHESNAVPGLTTKMLSGTVDKVMAAFGSVARECRKPERVVITGTPIREDFTRLDRAEAKRKLGLTGKPVVVSFWGSLGAEDMNSKMADFIRLNARSGQMYHIHATGGGAAGTARMVERLSTLGVYGLPDWEDLRPYIDNMGNLMAAADLVLCRAGASTLAELTALGRAAILVPSPYVTNDQQTKNAREIERAGGAVVVTEEGCTGEQLYNTAVSLLRDKERLAAMERDSARLGVRDATDRILKVILETMEK